MKNKTIKLPKYKLVLVEWVDSSRVGNGWVCWADLPAADAHKCISVGFIAQETKEAIMIVPSISDIENEHNLQAYGGILIPKPAIMSKRALA